MRAVWIALILLSGLVLLSVASGPATSFQQWSAIVCADQPSLFLIGDCFLRTGLFERISIFTSSQSAIFELRWVHIILSVATGFALATAGRSLQLLLQNPLADPHVVGLSAGSTTAVLIVILFAPNFVQNVFFGFVPAVWFPSFAGALMALLVVRSFFSTFVRLWGPSALALAGLFLNASFSALLMVIFARLSPSGLSEVQSWTLGAIQPYSLWQALVLLPPLFVSSFYLLSCERRLLLMSFGQDFAQTNGVNCARLRWQILLTLAVLCASAVCAAGSVGFVGLLVPHLTRSWFKNPSSPWVRPAFNGLMGANVLLFADLLSRTLTPPSELPVGVYTALLSVPFLLIVFLRSRPSF